MRNRGNQNRVQRGLPVPVPQLSIPPDAQSPDIPVPQVFSPPQHPQFPVILEALKPEISVPQLSTPPAAHLTCYIRSSVTYNTITTVIHFTKLSAGIPVPQ